MTREEQGPSRHNDGVPAPMQSVLCTVSTTPCCLGIHVRAVAKFGIRFRRISHSDVYGEVGDADLAPLVGVEQAAPLWSILEPRFLQP